MPSTINYNTVLYLHSSIFQVPFSLLRKTIIRLALRSLHESPSLGWMSRMQPSHDKKEIANCTSTSQLLILDLNRALFPHLSVLAWPGLRRLHEQASPQQRPPDLQGHPVLFLAAFVEQVLVHWQELGTLTCANGKEIMLTGFRPIEWNKLSYSEVQEEQSEIR